MLTKQQQEKISQRCTGIFVEAIRRLPEYLNRCEPETAASIIADMVKAGINLPSMESEEDPFEKCRQEMLRYDAEGGDE